MLSSAVATARAELLAAAPDAACATEAEAYLMRVMAGSLDDACLSHLRTENGLTRALPTKGGPNPDYLMWHAAVDPTRRYRLEGCLNESERAGVGVYSFSAGGAAVLAGYAAFDRTTTTADGCFSLELGADAKGVGMLALTPSCRVLLVRILHRAPQGRPCTLKLTGGQTHVGLDHGPGSGERALAQAGQAALRAVRQFLEWSRQTSANSNRISAPPPILAEEVRGDPETNYCLGYYELSEGEWLEVLIPSGLTGYWSLHAYNHWCESLPGAGAHDLSALPDPDGRIRVRIGPTLAPGFINRVDTLGRRRGVLIFRAIGAGTTQIPEAQLRR
jgi:hypothetical protein